MSDLFDPEKELTTRELLMGIERWLARLDQRYSALCAALGIEENEDDEEPIEEGVLT